MRIIIPCHILAKALSAISQKNGRIDQYPPCFIRSLSLYFANDIPHLCKNDVIRELIDMHFLLQNDNDCRELIASGKLKDSELKKDTLQRAGMGGIITIYEKLSILGEAK